MRLGTVIKPIGKDDYDVDLVCCLTKNTYYLSAEQLKKLVGTRLNQNENYKAKESRRCWKIQKDNYHLDILPAIPITHADVAKERDKQLEYNTENAIKITHKDDNGIYDFRYSNPKGYAKWFFSKMETYHKKLFDSRAIENIPEHPEKTPLQMAVQLMKRHRDIIGDFNVICNELEPISIIITTLSAHAYNHEVELYDCLENIVPKLTRNINYRNGVAEVLNPVMSHENFADKWSPFKKNGEAKKQTFLQWHCKLTQDFRLLFSLTDSEKIIAQLKSMFTDATVDKVLNRMGGTKTIHDSLNEESKLSNLPTTRFVGGLKHRIQPPWKSSLGARVGIRAEIVDQNGYLLHEYKNDGEALYKNQNINLYPLIPSSVKPPFRVKWQITNTGYEAMNAPNGLRGNRFEDSDLNNNGRHEYTSFTGSHIVQCFIVRGNSCLAKSGEFIVNIK
jgi:hypothetical protein